MARSAQDIQLKELKDTVKELRETIKLLNKVIAESEKEKALLREQVEYLTKKLFGSSSEKRTEQIEGQLGLFNEAEAEADSGVLEGQVIREHTRKPKATNADKFRGIPVEEREITLSDEERICEDCGAELVPMGREYLRTILEYTPAQVKAVKLYRVNYVCTPCKNSTTDEAVKIRKPHDNPLIPNSFSSPSVIAWIMYQKYVMALPLYRQEQDFKRNGIHISRTTLANWIIHCSNYFEPLYEYFHRKLLERGFLMADETTVQVLKEPGRRAENNSYMWVFRSGEDGNGTIILFGYSTTRNGDNAVSFLKGFSGYVMTDGFSGYNKLKDVNRCCCWAHVRRYFFDAIPKGRENDLSEPAVQGVNYCDALFALEREIKKKATTFDQIKELRLKKERKHLDAFWAWLDKQTPIAKGRMDKAVNYAKNRKHYLETYLEDGRCSFSNNLAENSIRPFTIGRKNWLFSDTVAGAKASATIYSIVEMAKANGLNIYEYLKYLLEHRPDADAPDEELEKLCPWNEQVRAVVGTVDET